MTKFWTTASAVAICASLGACASATYPIEPGAPAQAAPPTATTPPPSAAPAPEAPTVTAPPQSTAVESAPLGELPAASPAGQGPAYVTPSAPPEPTAPAYRAPPPRPAQDPPRRPSRPRSVAMIPAPGGGKLIKENPKPVVVAKGQTLIGISHDTGVLVASLADLNDLKPPYTLHPGQKIKLPPQQYYSVIDGDTLYAVSRRFGVSVDDLAEYNSIKASAPIKRGQRIYLPDDAKDKGAPKPIPAPGQAVERVPEPPPRARQPEAPSVRPAPVEETPPPLPSQPQPYRAGPGASRPATTYAPPPPARPDVAATLPTDAQVAAAGRGRFIWPVRGDVLSSYGPTGGGQRNDGINIATAPETPVRAAAAGEVVYAGDQVPGFGNLVLIKHEDGWVTAYAHLSDIQVKMRQTVAQGAIIGASGQSGQVDQPQLHFEVRYAPTPKDKARPVDPVLVLPK